MIPINLNNMPLDCIVCILKKTDNPRQLANHLSLVSKAFTSINETLYKNDDTSRNQLYLSKINNISDDQQKLKDILFLMKKEIFINKNLIPGMEVMFGLHPQLKALLEGRIYYISEISQSYKKRIL